LAIQQKNSRDQATQVKEIVIGCSVWGLGITTSEDWCWQCIHRKMVGKTL